MFLIKVDLGHEFELKLQGKKNSSKAIIQSWQLKKQENLLGYLT